MSAANQIALWRCAILKHLFLIFRNAVRKWVKKIRTLDMSMHFPSMATIYLAIYPSARQIHVYSNAVGVLLANFVVDRSEITCTEQA